MHDEVLLELQSVYGDEDGKSVHLITNSVSQLYQEWRIFLYFFAGKKERVEVLNKSSGSTARIIQKALWDNAISKVRRLTDPAVTRSNRNLSLQQLSLIANRVNSTNLSESYEAMIEKVGSCRKHSDKYLAHLDLPHAHGTQVSLVTRKETTTAVYEIGNFVRRFHQETRDVDYILMPIDGAVDEKKFLMHLHLGNQKDVAMREESLAKAKSGEPYQRSDYEWPEWIFDKQSDDRNNPFSD